MNDKELQAASEFQVLPLDFIVAAPLVAAVKAQAASAEATRGFILSLIDNDKKPITVDFHVDYQETSPAATIGKSVNVKAPLLSIVPIPHLRIDSLTTHFKFEITQTTKSTKAKDYSFDLSAKAGGMLSPWIDATFKGTVSSKSSEESAMNRSGVLEITVHASEAPMPEGLARVLNLLSNSIQAG